MRFRFDPSATRAAIKYILRELGGSCEFLKVYKILYFTDQKLLVRYAIPLTGETYTALARGPVPAATYDMFEELRGKRLRSLRPWLGDEFLVRNGTHLSLATGYEEVDLDDLSEAGLDVLQESIVENRHLSLEELSEKSHDQAWSAAVQNLEIPAVEIARAGGADDVMLAYVIEHLENAAVFT